MRNTLCLILLICLSFVSIASANSIYETNDAIEHLESRAESQGEESESQENPHELEDKTESLYFSSFHKPAIQALLFINEAVSEYRLREQRVSIKSLKPPQLNLF